MKEVSSVAHHEAGQRAGFAELFSQMAPRLYRTALGILGNPHDASDALQEAGLKAFRYYHTLHEPEAAPGWLTRILVNACHDQATRRARAVPFGLVPQGEEGATSDSEADWELVQAMQQLPDEQRVTVVLRFFQDLSVAQIATVTGVPEGTVKSRLHSALGKLRQHLSAGRREGLR